MRRHGKVPCHTDAAGVATAANIPPVASVPGDVAAHKVPFVSAVADVFVAVGVCSWLLRLTSLESLPLVPPSQLLLTCNHAAGDRDDGPRLHHV